MLELHQDFRAVAPWTPRYAEPRGSWRGGGRGELEVGGKVQITIFFFATVLKENLYVVFRSGFHCSDRRQCSERSGSKFGNNCEGGGMGMGPDYHCRRGPDLLSTLLFLRNLVLFNP